MARVMISCLTRMTDNELSFLGEVRQRLDAAGHELVLLSPHAYPEFGREHVYLPLDWSTWDGNFALGDLPIDEAMELLDVPLWLRRVESFVGDRHGKRDCLPLLRKMAAVALALLRRLTPGLFVSWNPPDPTTGVLFDIARATGTPAVGFERGFLPETLNVDPDRYGIFDSMAPLAWDDVPWSKDADALMRAGESFIARQYSGEFSRYAQRKPDVLGLIESGRWASLRPRVLVLGNYDMACAFSPGDPAWERSFPGYTSGFDLAMKVAISHGGVSVYKPHPVMMRRLSAFDCRGITNLLVGTGAPQDYIRWADVVVGYGSMLEYAALAFERPLVLAGRSSLVGKGIAYEAISADQLPSAIREAHDRAGFDERLDRFKRWVGHLTDEYLAVVASEEDRRRSADAWCAVLLKRLREVPCSASLADIRATLIEPQTPQRKLTTTLKSAVWKAKQKLARIIDAARS